MVYIAMRNHPRYQHSLEELFLKVFIQVDEWLKEHQKRFRLPVQANQVAGYSEIYRIQKDNHPNQRPSEAIFWNPTSTPLPDGR